MDVRTRWMLLRGGVGWLLIACGQACFAPYDPQKRLLDAALESVIHPRMVLSMKP